MSIEKYIPAARTSCFMSVGSIFYGAGSTNSVCSEVKRLSETKDPVLLVTDKGVMKAGVSNTVMKILEKEALSVEVYDELTAEPTLVNARKVAEKARERKYSVVIGVGGGAVMDMAKTAAVMATNAGDVNEYLALVEASEIKKEPLPKILLPTTSGTGSEVSTYAVIVDSKGVKSCITGPKVFANTAIVDPLNVITCPPKQTAGSGMDAMAHSLENFLSFGASPFSDMYALQSIRLVSQNLRRAYHWGENLEARYNMSLAALMGGWVMGATPNGGNVGHCISETLGPMYNVPHGVACALVTPYMMEYNMPACIERVAQTADVMGLNTGGVSKRDAAIMAIQAITDLLRDLEMPTSLKQVGFPKGDITKYAKYIVEERQFAYYLHLYNPRKLTIENFTKLLEKMYDGQILVE
jgi:alcohol dehydrogenase class IV